jgi:hypothetical protein
MEDWSKDNWQGKRKEQVDYSYKVMFYGTIILVSMIIISGISTLFK